VKNIHPVGDSVPAYLTNVAGTLFFSATDGITGQELWRSDGTSAGTVLVKDINPGGDSHPNDLFNANGSLVFSAIDGVTGRELWTSDGTSTGTSLLVDLNPGGGHALYSSLAQLTSFNGSLLFNGFNGADGFELWKTDGTSTGTILVRDLDPTTSSSYPQSLVDINGTLYFTAGSLGAIGLWKSLPWGHSPVT
jgi:ELWxxDGT repeat protein